MMRLVQGDVGAGKTVVAALAALQALEAGYQVALMAPTEILAEQHFITFKRWLEPLGIEVAWLAGKLKGKARAAWSRSPTVRRWWSAPMRCSRKRCSSSTWPWRSSTNSTASACSSAWPCARKASAGELCPHQLIMTATPIPRTLAMSAYADLDTSILDELPPGRTPVNTVLVADSRRFEVVERVRAACAEGRQAYWVCTLIEESEELTCQAAESTYEDLGSALGELRVGLIHGRMKPAEKAEIMAEFKAGNLQLLVATTVIEVGVDVPNASLMIIENPERLGLAQLHQLRGGLAGQRREPLRAAVPPAAVADRPRAPGHHARNQRRLHHRRKRPGAARPGRDARHPPDRPAAVQGRRPDARRRPAAGRARCRPGLVARWPDHVSPLLDRWLRHGQQYGQV
jgi:ATP-dependent DNA helicase RecG